MMSTVQREAADAIRQSELDELQLTVADAYLIVRAAGENDIGSNVDWGRFEVIAFEHVLRTMLADLRGPVEGDA